VTEIPLTMNPRGPRYVPSLEGGFPSPSPAEWIVDEARRLVAESLASESGCDPLVERLVTHRQRIGDARSAPALELLMRRVERAHLRSADHAEDVVQAELLDDEYGDCDAAHDRARWLIGLLTGNDVGPRCLHEGELAEFVKVGREQALRWLANQRSPLEPGKGLELFQVVAKRQVRALNKLVARWVISVDEGHRLRWMEESESGFSDEPPPRPLALDWFGFCGLDQHLLKTYGSWPKLDQAQLQAAIGRVNASPTDPFEISLRSTRISRQLLPYLLPRCFPDALESAERGWVTHPLGKYAVTLALKERAQIELHAKLAKNKRS
jgi:hypothetical protein